jgi:putative endonuclease
MAGAPQPSPSRKRRSAYLWGLRAETLAAVALRLKGWKLLARRYKAGNGEIDIIARKGDTIAFIEVKARATREAALAAITARGQRRIAAAARVWQAGREDTDAVTLRFDAVLVVPRRWPIHIANAFTAAER